MTIINLFLITAIICYIVDLSGFIDTIKITILKYIFAYKDKQTGTLYNIKNPDPSSLTIKPFDCSLCMTWWTNLIYLLCSGNLTLFNIFIVIILSLLASEISELLRLVKDFIITVEQIVKNYIQQIYTKYTNDIQ